MGDSPSSSPRGKYGGSILSRLFVSDANTKKRKRMNSVQHITVEEFLRLSPSAKGKYWGDLELAGQTFTENGSRLLDNGEFQRAQALYPEIIAHFRHMLAIAETMPNAEQRAQMTQALASEICICYYNLGFCCSKIAPRDLNKQIYAYLNALQWDPVNEYPRTNLWSCMDTVNKFLSARTVPALAPSREVTEWAKWHNLGYELLKTPYPPGTPDRNWQGAADAYVRALQVLPDRAESWHGLGLSYSGLGAQNDAIEAWLRAFELNPEHNFEFRLVAKFDV